MFDLIPNNISTVKKLKPIIICSKLEWELMDRADALKKECVERLKLNTNLGEKNKYIWIGIGAATKRS